MLANWQTARKSSEMNDARLYRNAATSLDKSRLEMLHEYGEQTTYHLLEALFPPNHPQPPLVSVPSVINQLMILEVGKPNYGGNWAG